MLGRKLRLRRLAQGFDLRYAAHAHDGEDGEGLAGQKSKRQRAHGRAGFRAKRLQALKNLKIFSAQKASSHFV